MKDKTKKICESLEKVTDCFKAYIDMGIDKADTSEVGEVADVIKDLAEALYYSQIVDAMEESEYGEDYDYQGRMPKYYTQGGSQGMSKGNSRYYTQHKVGGKMPQEYYRDMDRDDMRMYYTDSMSDSRMGKSAKSRVRYFDSKEMHSGNADADKKAKMSKLEDYMDDIYDDVSEMIMGESSEFKQTAKKKLMDMYNAM